MEPGQLKKKRDRVQQEHEKSDAEEGRQLVKTEEREKKKLAMRRSNRDQRSVMECGDDVRDDSAVIYRYTTLCIPWYSKYYSMTTILW